MGGPRRRDGRLPTLGDAQGSGFGGNGYRPDIVGMICRFFQLLRIDPYFAH